MTAIRHHLAVPLVYPRILYGPWQSRLKSAIPNTLMSKSSLFRISALIPLAPIVVGLMTSTSGLAQTLSGIQIGDTIATASKRIGFPPNKIDRSGPLTSSTWKLNNNNKIGVTTRDDKIVYMEINWGRISPKTDFPDLLFSQTSRQDLWLKCGSNGIYFERKAAVSKEDDGSLVATDIYEIANSDLIVAFVSRMDDATARALAKKGKTYFVQNLWKSVLLAAIIIAKRDRIEDLWGKSKGASKDYRPITLDVLQSQATIAPPAKKSEKINLVDRDGRKTVLVK